MKVSCLCITEGRGEFAEWMIWNYRKQDYPDKEFVLVASEMDTGLVELVKELIPDAIVETTPNGTWVPVKRNIAMSLASGDAFTWFDDDDWTSASRVSHLVESFDTTKKMLVPTRTGLYYFHLKHWKARFMKCSAWAYGLYSRELCLSVPFDDHQRRATDTKWLAFMTTAAKEENIQRLSMSGHAMAVSHKKNISNPMWTVRPMAYQYDWDHIMKNLVLLPGEEGLIRDYLTRIKEDQGIE